MPKNMATSQTNIPTDLAYLFLNSDAFMGHSISSNDSRHLASQIY